MKSTDRIVIVGASSGIGHEVARCFLEAGHSVALAARRTEPLAALAREFPGRVVYAELDVTKEDTPARLRHLIAACGGMELYLHVAGVGWQNPTLEAEKELRTLDTNVLGFARCVGEAYRYFVGQGHGHLAAVTSIAGTKGLGAAPAYSASKAFCNTYLQALEQQAAIRQQNISFTDLRPGFVRTGLLDDGKRYPMLMDAKVVARQVVRALRRHRHVTVIDWRYRALTSLWRLIPDWFWRRMHIAN